MAKRRELDKKQRREAVNDVMTGSEEKAPARAEPIAESTNFVTSLPRAQSRQACGVQGSWGFDLVVPRNRSS
nr:hypothetical protein CPAG_06541 [Coccidioides posadasii RMSCC 3488]